MNPTASDALVFSGATGDLAYNKIFPALQAMVKRGRISVPVMIVASTRLNLRERSSPPRGPRRCLQSAGSW
jgi:glucose-6-phosphate 1-dehydrogenase